jgi:hypothetical protein
MIGPSFSRKPSRITHTGFGWPLDQKPQRARIAAGQNEQEDRRSVRLTLTPKGRAIHQSLQRQVGRLSKVAVTGLGAEERRHLVGLLQKVRSNLEKPS